MSVIHAETEEETGAPTTSHGLAWLVPSDQVINELDDTSGT